MNFDPELQVQIDALDSEVQASLKELLTLVTSAYLEGSDVSAVCLFHDGALLSMVRVNANEKTMLAMLASAARYIAQDVTKTDAHFVNNSSTIN